MSQTQEVEDWLLKCDEDETARCSFCGVGSDDTYAMMVNKSAGICDDCVSRIHDVFAGIAALGTNRVTH